MEYNSTKLIKLLVKNGWEEVRVKGSHVQFKHSEFDNLITVPHPKKDLPKGLVKKIYSMSGLE